MNNVSPLMLGALVLGAVAIFSAALDGAVAGRGGIADGAGDLIPIALLVVLALIGRRWLKKSGERRDDRPPAPRRRPPLRPPDPDDLP